MGYGITRGLILIIEILYDGLRTNEPHFSTTMVQRRIYGVFIYLCIDGVFCEHS